MDPAEMDDEMVESIDALERLERLLARPEPERQEATARPEVQEVQTTPSPLERPWGNTFGRK